MFYWNEEELANIVWGEVGDSDDHIVPYRKGSDDHGKDLNQDSKRQTGRDTRKAKNAAHGRKLDSDSNFTTNKGMVVPGFSLDPWPEPPLSNATKTGGTFEFVKDSEVFENPQQSKEQGDFVDDGWATIGSFDDFDRVFSNDDEIFGSTSIGNDEDLRPSPSLGFGTSIDASEHLGIKTEEMQDDESLTLSYEKIDDPANHGSLSSNADVHRAEYVGGQNKSMPNQTDLDVEGKAIFEKPHLTGQNVVAPNEFADKTYKPRKLLKRAKTGERNDGKVLPDLYRNWSSPGPFNQLVPSMAQSHNPSILVNQFMHTSTMSLPSHLQSAELKHQHLLADASPKHQTMTPQEKIEKLRRRQQMQALHAIEKQQQQFNRQTISTDVEYPSNRHSLDPSSAMDREESNAIFTAVDGYSWEEIVLNQLQDTVAKLDMRLRVSMRDSLFRLGHSAVQRQYNTSKSSRDDTFGKQEINNTTRMTDEETNTNRIDRTVAHLLFHRNLETPESQTTLPMECLL